MWVGVTGNNPYYEPSVDGGLSIEVMEPGSLQLPEDTWADPPPSPKDPAPGETIRIVSRGYLVEDLDDVLRRLSLNLDWEPVGLTEDIAEEGYRRARMSLALPHGSDVELIQPTRFDCDAGRFLGARDLPHPDRGGRPRRQGERPGGAGHPLFGDAGKPGGQRTQTPRRAG
jgi:hypothetical protein